MVLITSGRMIARRGLPLDVTVRLMPRRGYQSDLAGDAETSPDRLVGGAVIDLVVSNFT
jgi:hypothetical protein